MRKTILFLLFCFLPCVSQAETQVYFSPNGGCERAVVSEMMKAEHTIDIAMYYLSSREIAKALVKALDRNVAIRIVLDQGQEIESSSKSGYLVKHGLSVRYHMGFGLMHNKFAIMDGQSLITGSFNWTRTAEEKNEENLLIMDDPKIINQYKDRFEYLWRTSRPDSRNAKGVDVVPSWFCSNFHVFCGN
ncbi:MAG: DUF1669 domain-containing protein [Candidatus Omnitrophica bacterium]|nr:DUF1669 domain-containing protein [Candidatus Omnitrophota bacterium]